MKKYIMAAAIALIATSNANAANEYLISIKDHKVSPANLDVPANQKIKLIVSNNDKTAEEFESHDLKREKVIQGNSKATILVGPLKPGVYKFVGEFHEDIAKGTITAK